MRRLTIAFILLACSLAATAQTITGGVRNGTTRKPAAGTEVVLVKLAQGMDEVGKTRTNSEGQFTLKVPDPSANYMVRVRFQDVYYNAQIPPGVTTAQITVYNSAPTVPEIQLIDHSQVFETANQTLNVIEVFNLRNISNPPVTQPAFTFYVPEGATVRTGQAVSSSGMPVPVEATPLPEKGKYQFVYPLRPGNIRFELVYTLPYSGSYRMEPRLPMKAFKFFAVVPRSMGFKPVGGAAFHPDQWSIEPTLDMNTNAVDSPAPGQSLAYEISGAGQIPQDTQPQQQQGNSRQAPDSRRGGGLGVPNEKPNPISSGQWAFLGVMTLFMAAGAAFIFLQTQSTTVPAAAPSKGGAGSLLDALKEEMFQLEADRLQGKVSSQEYESAKGALNKTLQRAMKHK
ncbi:MAG: carboxypeptidase-like regulatory domain-containing protein [Acidobacteriia bacterium]|nr:carboxypeptidase-like regulatory domain-containing protein [Terriglobia bacterium]